MGIYRKEILMQSSGKGTYEITADVAEGVRESGALRWTRFRICTSHQLQPGSYGKCRPNG